MGILLLAAGASRRMGQPKQLLPYREGSLIRYLAEQAVESKVGKVLVVLGSHRAAVEAELAGSGADVCFNPLWEEGMGSTIGYGLNQMLLKEPALAAVVIMLSDQPRVTAGLLQRLASAYLPESESIVASAYSGTFGPPLLLDRHFFPLLHSLSGDEGAKRVLRDFHDRMSLIDFPDGSIDLDTPDDLAQLR